MNDQDLIRKAVELADGWEIDTGFGKEWLTDPSGHGVHFPPENQWMLDALAAQLVRQVDAAEGYWVVTTSKDAHVMGGDGKQFGQSLGPDRTMNTLRAIVESGVLG